MNVFFPQKEIMILYTIEYTYQNGDFMKQETFEIEAEYEGERLDKYLSVILSSQKPLQMHLHVLFSETDQRRPCKSK